MVGSGQVPGGASDMILYIICLRCQVPVGGIGWFTWSVALDVEGRYLPKPNFTHTHTVRGGIRPGLDGSERWGRTAAGQTGHEISKVMYAPRTALPPPSRLAPRPLLHRRVDQPGSLRSFVLTVGQCSVGVIIKGAVALCGSQNYYSGEEHGSDVTDAVHHLPRR
jgi:hypothetical protein